MSSRVGVKRFRSNYCFRLHDKFDVLKMERACFFENLVIIDQTSSQHNQKTVVLVQITVITSIHIKALMYAVNCLVLYYSTLHPVKS